MRAEPPAGVTATRVSAAALLLVALLLGWVNRRAPDESRLLAVALAAIAAAALWRGDGAARGVLHAAALVTLFFTGGEAMVRRENACAQRLYAETVIHMLPDPLLRYEMKPFAQGTNSLGMLDREHARDKPPGVFRVACVGDSVGADVSLPRANACAALEPALAPLLGRPVETLNFSVPGYNTMQEARAFELKALPFSPDALVVLYVMNDPYPDLAISHLLPGHLKFEHILFNGVRVLLGRWLHLSIDPLSGMLDWLYRDPRAWRDVVVAGFARIADSARAQRLPVVVAVFPLFVPDANRRYGAYYTQVADEARRHGFIAVDLSRAAYADEPLAALLKPSRDPIHPNAHAHALSAQAIARALVSGRGEP